jgi:acyl-coenzyme A thioesterase PaaI-like protein
MNEPAIPADVLHRYFQRDRFANLVGLVVADIAPGFVRVRLPVSDALHNGLNIVHARTVPGML